MYIFWKRILHCIFSHSKSAAPVHFLHSHRLAYLAYTALNRQFQQLLVGLGRQIVEKFHVVDRNRNSW